MGHTRLIFVILSTIMLAACFPIQGSPGYFVVTTGEDAEDRNVGDGRCSSTLSNGACTLRAAVSESNAMPGENTIKLGPRIHAMRLPSRLHVTDDLRIEGAGRGRTGINRAAPHTTREAGFFLIDDARAWITDLSMAVIQGDDEAGGAMHVVNRAFVSLSNVEFDQCWGPRRGGAIRVFNSNLIIVDTSFWRNGAIEQGGGIWIDDTSTVTVDRSSFIDNFAGTGAAIYNQGNLKITNTTISGNRGSSPLPGTSGIFNSGKLHLNNVTIVNNRSSSPGSARNYSGGLTNGSSGRITMSNTILANNALAGAGDDCAGEIISYGYNLVESPDGCSLTDILTGNVIGVDPDLLPLATNGGRTRSHMPNTSSPALNAGHPQVGAGVPGLGRCEPRDQTGKIRQLTGAGERCEIGAVERW